MRLLMALLLCCLGITARAAPPPFVITGPLDSATITVYSDLMPDPGGKLTLEDVRSKAMDSRFQPATSNIERLGFSNEAWWTRLALRNETDKKATYLLELAPGLVRDITFYRPDGQGGYNTQRAGFGHAYPWGDVHYRNLLFRVTLPPGQTRIYYMRILPDQSFNYGLHLNSPAYQVRHSLFTDMFYLLLGGLILGLVIYNISIAVTAGDATYFWYGILLLFLTLGSLSAAGILGLQYWFHPGWQPRLEAIGVLGALGANALFTRRFLHLWNYMPRLDQAARATAAFFLLLILVSWLPSAAQTLQATYLLAAITALGFLWVGVLCWRLEETQAPLYVLVRSVLTVCVLLTVAAVEGWHVVQWPFPLLILGAAAAEALLFALGLAHKSRRELTQRLGREQQRLLEQATHDVRHEALARMSHEIRTPMSGILGMAEILDDTPLTPNQKEYVRAIRNSGENLLRVVNDVLDYTHIEQGDAEFQRETFDLTEALMEALDIFRERAEEKDIELITHIHTNVPTRVEGDRARLRQVLTNLLGAAIRHGQSGELVVDLARDASGRSNHLRFEFSGSSLRESWSQLALLEYPERRAGGENSTTLGLSIARQLIEAMEGQVGVRRDRNQQPLCWFSLPLPAVSDEEAEAQPNTEILHGCSLLIVDDSSTVTRVIRQQALSWGMRVTVSHAPREALATIRTQATLGEPFDVILLDHLMPGMNGMQLAARIQEDPVINHAPVLIMLTGIQAAPSMTMARNVGVHRVLSKPVSGPYLRKVLTAELDQRARREHAIASSDNPNPALRILVAEDHLLSQKVVRGMLAKLNLDADVVGNGVEAVDAVQRGDYDVVLMDCEMPEMNGFEATRRIREWEYKVGRRPVPIIALTAHILREHKERSLEAGMNAHVPKPVELEVLRDAIVRFTGAAGTQPDSYPASDETPG